MQSQLSSPAVRGAATPGHATATQPKAARVSHKPYPTPIFAPPSQCGSPALRSPALAGANRPCASPLAAAFGQAERDCSPTSSRAEFSFIRRTPFHTTPYGPMPTGNLPPPANNNGWIDITGAQPLYDGVDRVRLSVARPDSGFHHETTVATASPIHHWGNGTPHPPTVAHGRFSRRESSCAAPPVHETARRLEFAGDANPQSVGSQKKTFSEEAKMAISNKRLSPPADLGLLRSAQEFLARFPARAFEDPNHPLEPQHSVAPHIKVDSRERHVELGRLQPEYINYLRTVPKPRREPGNPNHPMTPRARYAYQCREWKKVVHAWRRVLHVYGVEGGAEAEAPAAVDPPALLDAAAESTTTFPPMRVGEYDNEVAKTTTKWQSGANPSPLSRTPIARAASGQCTPINGDVSPPFVENTPSPLRPTPKPAARCAKPY